MKLNHINLVVNSVRDAILFFETYFKFKCVEIKGEQIVAVLKDEEDFALVIMQGKEGEAIYPKAFHIGFMQQNVERVNQIFHQLKTAGLVGENEPGKIRGGFGFYFHFENIMIEVGTYAN